MFFEEDKVVKNVVIYLRVSTKEQAEKGYSIENQRRELEEYCQRNNLTILEEFCDAGITGTKIVGRDSFNDLLDAVESNKKIDAVLVWKLSRLSRKLRDILNILDFFESHKVSLIATQDSIDTSKKFGKTVLQTLGIVAEIERDNIVTQSRGGMQEKAMQGLWNGGPIPTGYDYIEIGRDDKGKSIKRLIPNEREANVIRTIFDLYVNRDYGYSRICQFLNSDLDAYKNKNDNPWSYSTVKSVLDNPIYIGKIRWGLHTDWNKKRRAGTNNNIKLHDGMHEAIIDDKLWEQTRKKRELVGKSPIKTSTFTFPLSGLLKCPQCGASMVANKSSRKNKKTGETVFYRYYVCSKWNNYKSKVCKPNSIKAEEIESQVVAKVKEFCQRDEVIKALVEKSGSKVNVKDIDKQIKTIEKRIKNLKESEEQQCRNLGNVSLIKRVGMDNIVADIERLQKERETEEAELERLFIQKNSITNTKMSSEKIAILLSRFNVIFDKMTITEQKKLLHKLIVSIKVIQSEDINERKASEIVLKLNNQSINCLDDTNGNDKKDNEKMFGSIVVSRTIS